MSQKGYLVVECSFRFFQRSGNFLVIPVTCGFSIIIKGSFGYMNSNLIPTMTMLVYFVEFVIYIRIYFIFLMLLPS